MPTHSFPSPDRRFRLDISMPEFDTPEARAQIALIATVSGEPILELIGPPVMPAAMFTGGNELHLALAGRSGRAWMVVIDLDARTFRIPGRIDQVHPLAGLGAALDSLREPDPGAPYQPPEPVPVPVNAGPCLCASHRPLPPGWREGSDGAWAEGRYGLSWGVYTLPGPRGKFFEAPRIVECGSDDVVLDLIGTFWDVRIDYVGGTSDLLKVELKRFMAPGPARTVFIALDVEKYWPDLGPGPHPEAVRDLDELHQELVSAPGILTDDGPAPRVRPSKMRPEMVLRRMSP